MGKTAIGETPEVPWVSWVEMLKKKYIQPKAFTWTKEGIEALQADEKFKALTPAPVEGGAVDIAKVKTAIGETPEAPWVSWVQMLKKKYIQSKAFTWTKEGIEALQADEKFK